VGDFSSGGSGGPLIGLLKTTNAGNTWTPLGSLSGMNIRVVIPTAVLDAGTGQQVVLVASTNGGIWRSKDGGNSFTQLSGAGTGLPGGSLTDVVADPGQASRFYAAVSGVGVFRSDDAGQHWTALTTGMIDFTSSLDIRLAVHDDANGNIVFAMPEDPLGTDNTNVVVYHSSTLGASWTAMDRSFGIVHEFSPGDGHLTIAADHYYPSVVWIGGYGYQGQIWRGDFTAPFGSEWKVAQGTGANDTNVHDDHRRMVIDANKDVLESDDGGIFRLMNSGYASQHWVPLAGTLQTTEFTSVAYDTANHLVLGGSQDNGSEEQSASNNPAWDIVFGGDGTTVAIDNSGTSAIRYSLLSTKTMS
jgi:hypothetical protein